MRKQSREIQNAYFHSGDLGCLKNLPELELLTHKDLYIEQACYSQLTDEQKNLLHGNVGTGCLLGKTGHLLCNKGTDSGKSKCFLVLVVSTSY